MSGSGRTDLELALPKAPRRLGPAQRYRLALLAERPRFYTARRDTILAGLRRHGYAEATGRLDKNGREEWAITPEGRRALQAPSAGEQA